MHFFNNREISDHLNQDFFWGDNFRVDSFHGRKFCHFSAGLVSMKIEYIRGIIGIKTKILIVCMEKRFCKNSYQTETSQLVCIAYQTRIWNPGVFGTSTINFFCQIS